MKNPITVSDIKFLLEKERPMFVKKTDLFEEYELMTNIHIRFYPRSRYISVFNESLGFESLISSDLSKEIISVDEYDSVYRYIEAIQHNWLIKVKSEIDSIKHEYNNK